MKDFLNKTEKELMTLLGDKQKALKDFRFGTSGSKNRNVKEAMNIRKDIARIMTVLNKKTPTTTA